MTDVVHTGTDERHDCCDHHDTPAHSRVPFPARAILWYQKAFAYKLSPCRFYPSCSNYALEAFETYGNGRALWLTIRRLARCRPFGPSGFDPVPEPPQSLERP